MAVLVIRSLDEIRQIAIEHLTCYSLPGRCDKDVRLRGQGNARFIKMPQTAKKLNGGYNGNK